MLLAAVLAVAATVLLNADQRGRSEQHLLVTALTDATTPAKGLTAADFTVKEDNLAREVIRVEPAPPPSHVMLLVDDSQASERSIQFLRAGLAAFITRLTAMKPTPQLALMTFGERPTVRAEFSPKSDAVKAAAGKMFAVPGPGSYLLQAIMDTCKDLRSPCLGAGERLLSPLRIRGRRSVPCVDFIEFLWADRAPLAKDLVPLSCGQGEITACLRCVQGCPKRLIHKTINPEYERLGDDVYTPDIISINWEQAKSGKIPVSGAGYGGPLLASAGA